MGTKTDSGVRVGAVKYGPKLTGHAVKTDTSSLGSTSYQLAGWAQVDRVHSGSPPPVVISELWGDVQKTAYVAIHEFGLADGLSAGVLSGFSTQVGLRETLRHLLARDRGGFTTVSQLAAELGAPNAEVVEALRSLRGEVRWLPKRDQFGGQWLTSADSPRTWRENLLMLRAFIAKSV